VDLPVSSTKETEIHNEITASALQENAHDSFYSNVFSRQQIEDSHDRSTNSIFQELGLNNMDFTPPLPPSSSLGIGNSNIDMDMPQNTLELPVVCEADGSSHVTSFISIPVEDIGFEVANISPGNDIMNQAVAFIDEHMLQNEHFPLIFDEAYTSGDNSRSNSELEDTNVGGSPSNRSDKDRANENCKRYRQRKKERESAIDILLKNELSKNKQLKEKEAKLAEKVKKLKYFYINKIKNGEVGIKRSG